MSAASSTPPTIGQVDAATFIEEHRKRGEHVVIGTWAGAFLCHPGCSLPCEYSGHQVLNPPAIAPVYVAEIREDGTIGPLEHAAWEDVAKHLDPVAFAERNGE
jgi:hypothetical protein